MLAAASASRKNGTPDYAERQDDVAKEYSSFQTKSIEKLAMESAIF
jgi:hypothetical protein